MVAASLATALYFYPLLPDQVPPHFGPATGSNGYTSRGWAAFFPTALIAALALIFFTLPEIQAGRGLLLSTWRSHRWVRGGVLTFLWWAQLLSLNAAVAPERRFEAHPVLGGLGLLFVIMGLALTELSLPPPPGLPGRGTLASGLAWRRAQQLTRGLWISGGTAVVGLTLHLPETTLLPVLGALFSALLLFPIGFAYLESLRQSR